MDAPSGVILVTGFLGSGKTTLINHLIRSVPPPVKLAVLMNEFAEVGVDAAMVERRDHLDVIEVRKGSIFCVCAKKEFLRGLAYVAEQIRPDRLLIEATGVANPADIKKDLSLALFKGRFRFLKQICLVDCVQFEAAYHVYAAVERQIATSDLFVLNKTDLAGEAQIRSVRALIGAHHPAPRFVETAHARVPISALLDHDEAVPSDPPVASTPVAHRAQEPPDRMVSAVYVWGGGSRVELDHALERLPAALPRLKGFVELEGEVLLLDGVMGRYTCTPAGQVSARLPRELRNRVVCIAPQATLDQVDRAMQTARWVRQSRSDPFMEMRPSTAHPSW